MSRLNFHVFIFIISYNHEYNQPVFSWKTWILSNPASSSSRRSVFSVFWFCCFALWISHENHSRRQNFQNLVFFGAFWIILKKWHCYQVFSFCDFHGFWGPRTIILEFWRGRKGLQKRAIFLGGSRFLARWGVWGGDSPKFRRSRAFPPPNWYPQILSRPYSGTLTLKNLEVLDCSQSKRKM